MIGKLTESEIEEILNSQEIGLLSCHADEQNCTVPINYLYKTKAIYAQTLPGRHVEMMRKNPYISLEVDEIWGTFSCKTVILKGIFEEIVDEHAKQQAIHPFILTLMPLKVLPAKKLSLAFLSDVEEEVETIVFKIIVESKRGFFEQNDPY